MGLGGWFAIDQVQRHEDRLAEQSTLEARQATADQLRAEAAAMAASIDGNLHDSLATGYGSLTLEKWTDAPRELQAFRDEVLALGSRLGTDAEVTTYRIKNTERLAVQARSNELRPEALQELISTGDSSDGWAQDAAYLPDMELPLIPHQTVSMEIEGEDGPEITAFAALEDRNGDLKGFVQLATPSPQVESLAAERTRTLIPLMAGGGMLMFLSIVFSSAALRRDLRSLKERISMLGKADEDSDLLPATLSEFHEVLQRAEQADQSVSRKLEREEAARADLESRLRDAELGLCPSRRAHRERFAKAAKDIQATLSVDPTRSVPGTLVDLTLEEAIIGLPAGGAVDLAPGFPARIRISSPGDDKIAEFVVETLNRASVGKMCLVRLRITNPANMRSLPRELRHLVDNRRSVRVQPDPRNPVIARLAFDRGREERNARLIDLSAEGAGLHLREDLWKMAAWGASVELRLVLPDTEQSIKLPARIICATRSAGRVRVGIEFDLQRIANGPHYRKVKEYLLSRQAELQDQLIAEAPPRASSRRRA
jgi:hypothetical protein